MILALKHAMPYATKCTQCGQHKVYEPAPELRSLTDLVCEKCKKQRKKGPARLIKRFM